MDGRWTIFVCTGCEEATGRHRDCDAVREATPVVPCDDAAVDRLSAWIEQCIKDDAWPTAESCIEELTGRTP